ncbi:uncharacterized protein METZ01_LOCUS83748, partial [marine metagenome]
MKWSFFGRLGDFIYGTRMCASEGKNLCQFCAISLQNQAILGD